MQDKSTEADINAQEFQQKSASQQEPIEST